MWLIDVEDLVEVHAHTKLHGDVEGWNGADGGVEAASVEEELREGVMGWNASPLSSVSCHGQSRTSVPYTKQAVLHNHK